MSSSTLDWDRQSCAPMGALEYVVECRQAGRIEKWFVVRPHGDVAASMRRKGVSLPSGGRIVVDAHSLRTVGVLGGDVPPPTPAAHGHNPYFDLLPT
jgi:hypothetical protein